MNCRQIRRILNERDISRLDSHELERVDAHVAHCPDCSQLWITQQLVSSRHVPPTPPGLAERVRLALEAVAQSTVTPFPVRRTVTIVSLALIGAAAASMLVIRYADRFGLEPVTEVSDTTTSQPSRATAVPEAQPQAANGVVDDAGEETGLDQVPSLDKSIVLVLPVDNSTRSQALAAIAVRYRDGFEDRLRETQGIYVADSSVVPAMRETGLSNVEIARAFGAGLVIEFSTREFERTDSPMIQYEIYDAATERTYVSGGRSADGLQLDVDPATVNPRLRIDPYEIIVENLRRYALGEPDPFGQRSPAELLAIVSDTNVFELERSSALSELRMHLYTGEIDESAYVDAALMLIRTSMSFGKRSAWSSFEDIDDPRLIPALAEALRSEQDEGILLEVIEKSRDFPNESSLIQGLQNLASNGPTRAVEEAAGFSLLPPEEQFMQRKNEFMDTSRPVEERLEAFGAVTDYELRVDNEIASELIRIASEAENLNHQVRALLAFDSQGLDTFIDPLIGFLAPNWHEEVRAAAAAVLGSYEDQPLIRTTLEAVAAQDPDRSVRFSASDALRRLDNPR